MLHHEKKLLARSCDVIRQAADKIGVKALAAKLRLSTATVYKWCEGRSSLDPSAGGAANPVDRVAEIVRATGDDMPVRWLCERAGGFFVSNPSPPNHTARNPTTLVENTQVLVREFSQLLLAVTNSLADDGEISKEEASRIRAAWEVFKSQVEHFTVACEMEFFHSKARVPTTKDPGDPHGRRR